MIENTQELLEEIGAETIAAAVKGIFKYTDAGVSANFEFDGVTVSSIVEGSDIEITRPKLKFPFEDHEFWDLLEEVNTEACAEWDSLYENDGHDDLEDAIVLL